MEWQHDGYFAFVQEGIFEPGPMERWDPKMRDRFVMEGREQLVNMASDSEKEEVGKRESAKERRRERRRARRQRKMPFGTFVVDLVGGGRTFVRDI